MESYCEVAEDSSSLSPPHTSKTSVISISRKDLEVERLGWRYKEDVGGVEIDVGNIDVCFCVFVEDTGIRVRMEYKDSSPFIYT